MKTAIRFSVRIKGCKKTLLEGHPPGTIAVEDVEVKATKKEMESPRFAVWVLDKKDEFLNEIVEVDMEDVTQKKNDKRNKKTA